MGKILKKTAFALILAILFITQSSFDIYAATDVKTVPAKLTTAKICVNGEDWHYLNAYNIQGYNYVRLRDAAEMLDGTASQFNVIWRWDTSQNEIRTHRPYVYAETEKQNYKYSAKATPMTASLLVDGKSYQFPCYNIDNSNYFRLIDLSTVLNFYINWRAEDNSNYLETYASGNSARVWRPDYKSGMNKMDKWASIGNYGAISNSYIFENGDYIQALTVDSQYNSNTQKYDKKISVDAYDISFKRISSKNVVFEGEAFGAFYSGKYYNYIVFGNANIEENDNKEVIRVVKYDKDFNRIDAVSVKDCFTTSPFGFGSSDIAEYGDTLVLHTCRIRYLTSDGLRHQSQLTVIIDTQDMNVVNYDSLGKYQKNHVSHSFNQFVRFDGDTHVLIDHGDAYPRSVVLNKYVSRSGSYETLNLLDIPGKSGDNYTGVSLGGLEVTGSSYIAAVNSVNFTGNNKDTERDLIILSVPKNNLKKDAVQVIKLADYAGKNKCASMPYLVKAGENEIIVLWQEFDNKIINSYGYKYEEMKSASGVKWAKLDSEGNLKGEIHSVNNICLSKDCQPIYKNGKIIWYVDAPLARLFFNINVK